MTRVFIDGSAGTTGLRIVERLKHRSDLELLVLPEVLRKDPEARREKMNQAEIVFLCLPDQAAREAVDFVENPDTVIIDTSTAHRTCEGWTYGFPEICGLREQIRTAKRIANPGCHASGFVSLIAPLTQHGILKTDSLLTCFSLTGYSGGGKSMITDYEGENAASLAAPRLYGLGQQHKHQPEMVKLCRLQTPPCFTPIVSSYYAGMTVTVPLHTEQLSIGTEALKDFYRSYYQDQPLVQFVDEPEENGFLSAGTLAGCDKMQISVLGNEDRLTLISRFDNLGKGASGAAIQNMNIVLGVDETTGLELGG